MFFKDCNFKKQTPFSKSITCHIWSKNTFETWASTPFKQSSPKLKTNFSNSIALLFWNYITNISLTTYIIIMSMILDIYLFLPITSFWNTFASLDFYRFLFLLEIFLMQSWPNILRLWLLVLKKSFDTNFSWRNAFFGSLT